MTFFSGSSRASPKDWYALPAGAGFLMAAELNALNSALEKPTRPVAAIVGGAKISTKLALLGNLVQKVKPRSLEAAWQQPFHTRKATKSDCHYEKDMADSAKISQKKPWSINVRLSCLRIV